MATPTERIKALIPVLPEKDIKYANKFVNNRDFESLRDLVKSCITITRNSMKGKSELEKDIAVEKMELLYSEVNEYCALLGCDTPDSFEEGEEESTTLEYNEDGLEYEYF